MEARKVESASAMLESGVAPPREQTWIVPLSDVLVDDEIEQAVTEAVRSGWWSMGPRVGQLELEFAQFCSARHALAVANGTAALHLALLAVGCGPGDEVLLPSLNFVAAANTIRHTGADPVFSDIEGVDDLNVSPVDLEAAIGPRTRAIVVMHYGGYPCRMDAILDLAERHGLTVIEDAAHAPGALWRERRCGTIGSVGCFSFFSNKNLPVGEGGMIVTEDDALAARIRLLRSHGMTTLTWDRHRGHASTYDVVAEGFNYRLDELRAAIALVQLSRLEQQNAARARIVDFYREVLDGRSGMTIPFGREADVTPAHHLAVLVLPEGHERDEFRAALAERGIQTSVHYPPIHRFSAYRHLGSSRSLPVTEAIEPRLVTLPLYPHMSDDEVCAVTEAVVAVT
ncbi:MAG: DegT/DnrJ/EryC1/StrS family aminotransferase [Gaiellaceae bacterium]